MADTRTPADKILFISDVHLGGFQEVQNKDLENELIHLIDFCEQNKYKIYILGDLFDYWMEYPGHTPGIAKASQERFKAYNSNTGTTLYITGNHDNWTNGYFESLGFDIEKNYRYLQKEGKNILMLHGDGLDDPSLQLPRPLLHRFLRHPAFVKLYQAMLPPKTGLKAMKIFSRWTRSRENLESEKKVLNKWAENLLQKTDTDIIICGHDHFPRILNFDFGTFINLGTFYQHKTIATYNNGKFSLVVWDNAVRQLKPFYTGT